MLPPNDTPDLCPDPLEDYFTQRLEQALVNQHVHLGVPETAVYLRHLLERFLPVDTLYPVQPDHTREDPALALTLKKAMEEHGVSRELTTQRVGDLALVTVGIWPEYLHRIRRQVSVSYFISMGRHAYDALGSSSSHTPLRPMYNELAARFSDLADVLTEITEVHLPLHEHPEQIMRLSQRHAITKRAAFAYILREAGIAVGTSTKN